MSHGLARLKAKAVSVMGKIISVFALIDGVWSILVLLLHCGSKERKKNREKLLALT